MKKYMQFIDLLLCLLGILWALIVPPVAHDYCK